MEKFFLVASQRVLCECCFKAEGIDGSLLVVENIYPYKQNCHGCDKQLVVSRNDDFWPELFPKQTPDPARLEPQIGTLAFTARLMVGLGMDGDEADRWKDEMKDRMWEE